MKTMKLILPTVIAAICLMTACSQPVTKDKKTLTVAMELAYPPFETKDDSGNPTGISVDLAKAIGE